MAQPIYYPAADGLKVLAWGYLVLCAIAAVGVWVNFAETKVGYYSTEPNIVGMLASIAVFLQGAVVAGLLHTIADMAIDLRKLVQNSADKN